MQREITETAQGIHARPVATALAASLIDRDHAPVPQNGPVGAAADGEDRR
ncbi:hypothetical protein [Thiocapsa rosea]|nr:hypothetical protein [Thiocapsa rosea]